MEPMHSRTGRVTKIFAQSPSYVVYRHLYGCLPSHIPYCPSKYHGPKTIWHFQNACRILQSCHCNHVSIIIPTYDRVMVPLLAKYVGMPRGFSCRFRIGIGLLFVCASKATSAVVETIRRNAAIEEGFEDQPNAVIHMSVVASS